MIFCWILNRKINKNNSTKSLLCNINKNRMETPATLYFYMFTIYCNSQAPLQLTVLWGAHFANFSALGRFVDYTYRQYVRRRQH